MSPIARLFTPDHVSYDGVRPVNVYLLRLFYFLMAAFVGTDAWRTVLTQAGPWDHTALPLWYAGTLAASPANEMALTFLWVWVPVLAVPWGYVWRTYVRVADTDRRR